MAPPPMGPGGMMPPPGAMPPHMGPGGRFGPGPRGTALPVASGCSQIVWHFAFMCRLGTGMLRRYCAVTPAPPSRPRLYFPGLQVYRL